MSGQCSESDFRNMNFLRFFTFISVCSACCTRQPQDIRQDYARTCRLEEASAPAAEPAHRGIKGALLGTRFKSFEELKSVIQIEYFNNKTSLDSPAAENALVRISHCSSGTEVISVLEPGISQGDIARARDGNILDRLGLIVKSPYTVVNRADLERVYILSRWMPSWFGEGDIAFFDLAASSVKNINTEDLAFCNARDSTEKGYLNTFNHITAQAFITSCFSEKMADFVADAHERYHHPELITGRFTPEQIEDLAEGPVDNYVDVINNEWGQELGKQLRKKYNITRETYWTPALLAGYLNELQSYYSWAFQIGFKPFRAEDEIVIRFSDKINVLMSRKGRAIIGASGGSEKRGY